MSSTIPQVLQPIMQQLLDSAKEQYEAQLDMIQREYARHTTEIKAAFGAERKGQTDDATD